MLITNWIENFESIIFPFVEDITRKYNILHCNDCQILKIYRIRIIDISEPYQTGPNYGYFGSDKNTTKYWNA